MGSDTRDATDAVTLSLPFMPFPWKVRHFRFRNSISATCFCSKRVRDRCLCVTHYLLFLNGNHSAALYS